MSTTTPNPTICTKSEANQPQQPIKISPQGRLKPPTSTKSRFGFVSKVKPPQTSPKNNNDNSAPEKEGHNPANENIEPSTTKVIKRVARKLPGPMTRSRISKRTVSKPENQQEVPKKTTRITRAPTRTSTRVKKSTLATEKTSPRPQDKDPAPVQANSTNETNIMSLEDLIALCGNTTHQDEIEEILKIRLKASKFNLRAKVEEQMSLIRRMRPLIKILGEERKACAQYGKLINQKQEAEQSALTQQLETFTSKVQSQKDEIEQLQEKNILLQNQIKDSKQKNDQLVTDQQELTAKQHDELRMRMDAETEKSALKMQLSDSLHENSNLQNQIQILTASLDEAKTSAEEQSKAVDQVQLELQKQLAEQLSEEEEKHKQVIEEMSRTISEKKTECETFRKKIEGLEVEMQQKNIQLSEKELVCRTIEADKTINEKQLDLLKAEVLELKQRLQKKDDEVSNALNGLKQVQEFANSANSTLTSEKQELEKKIHRLEERIAESDQEKSKLTIENQSLQSRLTIQEEQNASMLQEASALRTEAEDARHQLQEKDKNAIVERELRVMLESQMREMRTEHTAVNAQLGAMKTESKMHAMQHSEALQNELEKQKELRVQLEEIKKQAALDAERQEEEKVALQTEVETIREAAHSVKSADLENLTKAKQEVEVLRLRLKEKAIAETSSIASKDALIVELEAKVRDGEAMRRKMHNTIQELRGNVRVFARTRPFLPSDNENGEGFAPVQCLEEMNELKLHAKHLPDAHSFKFDKVFPPSAGQDEVFEEVAEFVQSALDGYHVCLFSYGQTGSGKTHTMQGSGNDQMRGIIPRSIEKVLLQCETLKEQGWEYIMSVSFLEIYNENIRDLLSTANPTAPVDPKKHQIKQKGVKDDQLYVTDLTTIEVDSSEVIEKLMERASRQRSVASTDMNQQSSRSHSVFTLHIEGVNKTQHKSIEGKLNLVDLAGSERLSRSKATGDRKKETQAINKSLSCLTDVFSALGSKSKHVPFRNSKLTYLLRNCLSGDGKTLMMVNLSPTEKSYQESLCSLRFAQQVNKCELGKAKRKITQIADDR